MTQGGGTGGPILSIQYLRGLAAVLVVCFHSMIMKAAAPYYPIYIGSFGVDIFFVISGFIMLVTTEHRRSPLAFWKARAARIVPMYWLATLIFIAAAAASPGMLLTARQFDAGELLASFLFIPAQNRSIGGIVPLYTIGWSLNYEMFFYLVFGLCLMLADVRARLAACAAALCAIVWLGHLVQGGTPLEFYSRPIVLEFVAGMGLGLARRRLFSMPKPLSLALVAASVALFGIGCTKAAPLAWYAAGAVLLVAAALAWEETLRSSPNRVLNLLGDASYSIYLFHPFAQRAVFIALGSSIASSGKAFGYSALALAAGVAGGVLAYLLVEVRVLALARRLSGQGRRRPAAVA